jgi:tetratricopeptide (TPR) repeat protein
VAQVLRFWLEFKAYLQSAFGWIARTATIANLVALTWVGLSLVISVLIVREVTRNVVTIEPISVPKTLADSGYTSEVASHRLRDALNQYANANRASQLLEALNISASDELPDFVVPQIGLSLNAIVSSIRSVLHYSSGQTITGEIIFHDKYALRIRVDGRQVFGGGFDADNPDELLTKAAPAVTSNIQPYINAIALYRDHPEQGILKADDIIARREPSDINVQWAYVLKGNYFFDRNNYVEAEKMFRTAVGLNWSNPAPHNELGRALERQRRYDEAIAQYRRIIAMDPKSAVAYNNMGYAMFARSKPDQKHADAIEQYHRAIALEPRYMLARNNLGLALSSQGDVDDAVAEYRQAIQVDPKYLYAHWNLAAILRKRSNFELALAEYRAAIDCTKLTRDVAILHVSVGDTLKQQAGAGGTLDEAIAEYRRASEIDPAYSWAHNNLGMIWREQGKIADAIAEFHLALEADSKNATAKENLEQAEKIKDTAAKQADAPRELEASRQSEATRQADKQADAPKQAAAPKEADASKE